MTQTQVSSISIHPVKSFNPIFVQASRIVQGGGLEHDREFGLFDADGKFVNGKRNPKVHQLVTNVDWKEAIVYFKTVSLPESTLCFHLIHDKDKLESWLSEFFGEPVEWRRNPLGGFPDDLAAPGPTLISDATYREIASWYDGLEVSEIRKRFRANIEFGCIEPFWEDRLFADAGQVVRFKIGDVEFHGTNPCKRCVVPTRHTLGGESYPNFGNIFMAKREETLPEWANRSRFDHFYRLAINTRVPESEVGKQVRVGDKVEILGVYTPPPTT